MVSDMHVLKQQATCVADVKLSAKAFSVLGKVQQVDERKADAQSYWQAGGDGDGSTTFATFRRRRESSPSPMAAADAP
jgi:hypothetical protein